MIDIEGHWTTTFSSENPNPGQVSTRGGSEHASWSLRFRTTFGRLRAETTAIAATRLTRSVSGSIEVDDARPGVSCTGKLVPFYRAKNYSFHPALYVESRQGSVLVVSVPIIDLESGTGLWAYPPNDSYCSSPLKTVDECSRSAEREWRPVIEGLDDFSTETDRFTSCQRHLQNMFFTIDTRNGDLGPKGRRPNGSGSSPTQELLDYHGSRTDPDHATGVKWDRQWFATVTVTPLR